MSRIVVIALVVVLAGIAYALFSRSPVRRGVAADMLASSARPALLVRPAAGFVSAGAARADISPDTASASGTARVYFALHARPGDVRSGGAPTGAIRPDDPRAVNDGKAAGPALLVALLAEAGSEYRWPLDVASGLDEVRPASGELAGFAVRAATFVLPVERDALAAVSGGGQEPWRGGALVRRFTALTEMRHLKLVVEYREPLSGMPGAGNGARLGGPAVPDNPAALAAFEARAENAFVLERPGGDWNRGEGISMPEAAPEGVGRRELARMLGILERDRGDDR